ncbi:sel-2 [Pristionchus pacificus]|nr:sel-2 [Pristionchus pacificus]
MEDEDVNVVVDAPLSAPPAPAGAPHAPAAPDADRKAEAAEPEETVPPPPRTAENNNALAEPTFDSFPKLIDSAVPEPEADTVEIPSGTPEKKEEDTVAELEEVMEEIAIESAIVDEVKEEEEVTVAQKKEERSTVAPQQADTPLQQLHSALAAAKEQQEREQAEKRQREEPVKQSPVIETQPQSIKDVEVPAATVAAAAAPQAAPAAAPAAPAAAASPELPRQLLRTTVILSSDEKPAETFARLAAGMRDGSIQRNVVVDTIFNVLVAGAFDMEARFTIDDAANIERMLQLLQIGDLSFQAEVWSVFVAVVRKSIRNVEMCSRVGLISRLLDLLQTAPALLSDIYLQLVALVGQYSITVKETKRYLRALKVTEEGKWRRNSLRLVDVMRTLPKQDSTDVFFSFPGTPGAGIFLPPLRSFPYQAGWTFAAWVRMDPPNGTGFEKEKPVIYNFRSSKGASYSCHIVANFIVISVDKGKAGTPIMEKCVRSELRPRRWHHIALSHNYSRWGRSEVACYVDGHLADTVEMNWAITVADTWPQCAVGSAAGGVAAEPPFASFTGQMAGVYVFAESMSLQQAHSLYCMGPGYMSALRHEAECDLPEGYKKFLFDGRLHSSLLSLYSPKNCHGQLCLYTPPHKAAHAHYVQIAHAVMKGGVEVIRTHSLQSSLQSVGGMQMLLPLFDQLDAEVEEGDGEEAIDLCATLLSIVTRLLECSYTFQQQFVHARGVLIIAHALQKSDPRHLTVEVVQCIASLARLCNSAASGPVLLRHLLDHILFNPKLWIMADPAVQIQFYSYLSLDFMANSKFPEHIKRVATVIEMCHTLKHYYYVVAARYPSDWIPEQRSKTLSTENIITIRGSLLGLINKLILLGIPDKEAIVPSPMRDQEIHVLLNLVSTVHENDNLYDVLALVNRLLCDYPQLLIPALDRDHAIGMIFSLLAKPSPLIRIPALKLLGHFLARSTMKRKTEAVGANNALALLSDRLAMHTPHLAMPIYSVLFEILTEKMTPQQMYTDHMPPPKDSRFENPSLLKVISQLLINSDDSQEAMTVRKTFLIDLITMCKDSRENRRTILQMSVWQEWLIQLAYVYPLDEAQSEICELVYDLFNILLHHAIRHEYGGWRVWVDTLAIAHSQVSRERFHAEKAAATPTKSASSGQPSPTGSKSGSSEGKEAGDANGEEDGEKSTPDTPARTEPVYRTPEFSWSRVHLRLLRDLLQSIENVIDEWRTGAAQGTDPSNAVSDAVNHNDNHVFVSNVVHVISQLADSLIMACGGLLPLLASATSPNSELEIKDACGQDLPIEAAADLLSRFASLADTFVFQSSVSLVELEQEKNMPTGGILRETLRLIATCSVRHILACRERPPSFALDARATEKWDSITKFVKGALNARGKEGLHDMEHLMQEVDLTRIKGVVYRDMEETRQAQFLALAVIYLLSVLMVSRYRDILEPPSSPSPFFNSTNDKEASEQSSPSSSGMLPSSSERVNGAAGDGEKEENGMESNGVNGENGNDDTDSDSAIKKEKTEEKEVSAIRVQGGAEGVKDANPHSETELPRLAARSASVSSQPPAERRAYLTSKLCTALESTSPLLREIMTDFRSFFQKTLLGTHGQEIMNDTKVLETLKNKQGSVVELVMLLCSQEWQTSLQKHAGLAFIELVNEGRLMAHATRDHVLRVANEAEFILNRLRAEDNAKHELFQKKAQEELETRKAEEARMEHVLRASRRRDTLVATRLLDKAKGVLTGPSGAWKEKEKEKTEEFWRLDVWEDDSRRRLRFVPNQWGTRHVEEACETAYSNDEKRDGREIEEEEIAKLAGITPGRGQVVELVDESDIEKWATEVDAPPPTESTSYSTPARLCAPGVIVPGTLSITATDLYFDADEEDPLYAEQDPKSLRYCDNLHGRWQLVEIRAIFLRTSLLQNTALELFLATRTAVMFSFADHDTVRTVVGHLPRVGVGVKYGLPQSRKASLMTPRQLFRHSDMTERWQKREISNFDYLMFLNTVAGRSFNDLNQYPVFPWVLTNYTDEKLDLSVASNFRDLSKPIGALSEARRKQFEERYQNWDDPSTPPFHYGTHYSTAAFTLNWLMRVEPFSTMLIHLQGGRFDCPDRMFHSMGETWTRAQRDTHDVKELIPELFYLPEMLRNSNKLPLGKRMDGVEVGDVALPPWAKTPEQFIQIHRQALESDLVSCQLNQWIDLIFGYKQKGAEAVRACNVFYYLTYEGGVDLAKETDPVRREALLNQIASFGQTPLQLLTEAHPPRHSVMTVSPLMFGRTEEELCMAMKFVSNSPVVFLAANTFAQLPTPTILSITGNLVYSLNRWHNSYTGNTRGTGSIALSGEKEGEAATTAELPLTVDPLLISASPSAPIPRRHLGEAMVNTIKVSSRHFVATNDSRSIISCAYPDYSFRVTDTDTGATRQVVYGHADVVTCLARSETSLYADCYLATGSLDCTVHLWHWSGQLGRVAGDSDRPEGGATSRAILTGHEAPITALAVSAEHGLVISGCADGAVVIHTTAGELLRRSQLSATVSALAISRDCLILAQEGPRGLVVFSNTLRVLDRRESQFSIDCLTLTRDGEYFVTGSEQGIVALWRLFPLEQLYTYHRMEASIRSVAVTSNQRYVLAGLESGAIVVLNADFARWHSAK